MTISEMIEWLKTMPQDTVVKVLNHSLGHGYYMQGGSCSVVDFDNHIEYQQWKDDGDSSAIQYKLGNHFEYTTNKDGSKELQLGTVNN